MDLQRLFAMQEELDKHIETKHKLENKDLFKDKVVALLVELGELANETRCFKFWSLKESSGRDVILEEFVDGVHFILSLGIECKFNDDLSEINIKDNKSADLSLTDQFLTVYEAVQNFKVSPTYENYKNLFSEFLTLGKLLNYSSDEIFTAYLKKNEINFKRQEDGY